MCLGRSDQRFPLIVSNAYAIPLSNQLLRVYLSCLCFCTQTINLVSKSPVSTNTILPITTSLIFSNNFPVGPFRDRTYAAETLKFAAISWPISTYEFDFPQDFDLFMEDGDWWWREGSARIFGGKRKKNRGLVWWNGILKEKKNLRTPTRFHRL